MHAGGVDKSDHNSVSIRDSPYWYNCSLAYARAIRTLAHPVSRACESGLRLCVHLKNI